MLLAKTNVLKFLASSTGRLWVHLIFLKNQSYNKIPDLFLKTTKVYFFINLIYRHLQVCICGYWGVTLIFCWITKRLAAAYRRISEKDKNKKSKVKGKEEAGSSKKKSKESSPTLETKLSPVFTEVDQEII